MYILNIMKAIITMSINEIKDLSLKTIINKQDFLKKLVIIQRNTCLKQIYCCSLTN